MTNVKQASKAQSAKALAILHIQGHEGLDGVAVGDRIRYCEPSAGAGEYAFSEGEFTATEGDLQLAKMSRENAVELAKCAQDSRAAYKISAEQATKDEPGVLEQLSARYGADTAMTCVSDLWSQEECSMTPAEAIAMHTENQWTDDGYSVRNAFNPGDPTLVDKHGRAILTLPKA